MEAFAWGGVGPEFHQVVLNPNPKATAAVRLWALTRVSARGQEAAHGGGGGGCELEPQVQKHEVGGERRFRREGEVGGSTRSRCLKRLGEKCPEGKAPLLSGWRRAGGNRNVGFQFRSLWMLMFL